MFSPVNNIPLEKQKMPDWKDSNTLQDIIRLRILLLRIKRIELKNKLDRMNTLIRAKSIQ